MALRDKLAERSQQFLPEGTQIQQVFICQSGPNPAWIILTYLVFFAVKYRVVCVTDRGIYVLKASMFMPSKPKGLVGEMPRQQMLGPVSGLWSKIQVLGERHWVHKRFHKDIAAADAALSHAG